MTDEYSAVKRGKLILKGDKPKAKKRKHKKKEKSEESKVDIDLMKHGGWWQVDKIEDVTGSISIEFGNNSYISALDNGLFTVGAPHGDGEGPSPEEVFTAFPAGDTKFALKSGYGKYIGVSKAGVVIGRSDAVGPMEQWEPVWQDGKTAILSSLNKFMSVNPEDDSVEAQSLTADDHSFCCIRSNRTKEVDKSVLPEEEEGNLAEVEVNYVMDSTLKRGKPIKAQSREIIYNVYLYFLTEANAFKKTENGYFNKVQDRVVKATGISRRFLQNLLNEKDKNGDSAFETPKKGRPRKNFKLKKFQKFQDKKMRLNDGGVSELKKAKDDGTLHETLLDRRSKMKADRYCK